MDAVPYTFIDSVLHCLSSLSLDHVRQTNAWPWKCQAEVHCSKRTEDCLVIQLKSLDCQTYLRCSSSTGLPRDYLEVPKERLDYLRIRVVSILQNESGLQRLWLQGRRRSDAGTEVLMWHLNHNELLRVVTLHHVDQELMDLQQKNTITWEINVSDGLDKFVEAWENNCRPRSYRIQGFADDFAKALKSDAFFRGFGGLILTHPTAEATIIFLE
uniref:F-box domain-containing protein n=1 Tax=Steinernema glaseri TaxID=37863 RepID=A0A1I8AKZ2_9BILA